LLVVEYGFASAAVCLALLALGLGTFRHGSFRPWAFGFPGLCMITAGVFSRLHDVPVLGSTVVLAGGLLMVLAHMDNLRIGRATHFNPGRDGPMVMR